MNESAYDRELETNIDLVGKIHALGCIIYFIPPNTNNPQVRSRQETDHQGEAEVPTVQEVLKEPGVPQGLAVLNQAQLRPRNFPRFVNCKPIQRINVI